MYYKERILSLAWLESRQRGCSLDVARMIIYGTIRRLRLIGWDWERIIFYLELRQVKDMSDRRAFDVLTEVKKDIELKNIIIERKIELKEEIETILDRAVKSAVDRLISCSWTTADIRYWGQRIRRKKVELLAKMPPRLAVELMARLLNE